MPQKQTLKNPCRYVIIVKSQATIEINAISSAERNTKTIAGNFNNGQTKSEPNNKKTPTLPKKTIQRTEPTENHELSTELLRPVAIGTIPQRNAISEPTQQTTSLTQKTNKTTSESMTGHTKQ